jgi:hypothetical protein
MYDVKSNLVIGFHGCERRWGPAFAGAGFFMPREEIDFIDWLERKAV